MPSKIAAPSPRRGVNIGDTSHQVSVVGLYFSTLFNVFLPKISSIQTVSDIGKNEYVTEICVELSHEQGSIFSSIFLKSSVGQVCRILDCNRCINYTTVDMRGALTSMEQHN